MRQLKSSIRLLKNSWLELRRGARAKEQVGEAMETEWKEKLTDKKSEEGTIFLRTQKMQKRKGTLVSMPIISLQRREKKVSAVWVISSLPSQLGHSPLTRVNFLRHNDSPPPHNHQYVPLTKAQIRWNILAHSSVKVSEDFSAATPKVHLSDSVPLDFWNGRTLLTLSWNNFLKRHTYSKHLLPSN